MKRARPSCDSRVQNYRWRNMLKPAFHHQLCIDPRTLCTACWSVGTCTFCMCLCALVSTHLPPTGSWQAHTVRVGDTARCDESAVETSPYILPTSTPVVKVGAERGNSLPMFLCPHKVPVSSQSHLSFPSVLFPFFPHCLLPRVRKGADPWPWSRFTMKAEGLACPLIFN